MPQIIVTADDANLEGTVTLRERINESDFESERFAVNLLERLGWAVSDATDVEQGAADPARPADEVERPADEVERPADEVERPAAHRPELVEA